MLHARRSIAKGLIAFAGTRWPKTTGDFAFRVFTRVPRRADKGTAGHGMPDGVQPETLAIAGGAVATWSYPAENPTGRRALLVHGWNSRSRHMMTLARALNAAGIDVVLLDLPGHGASGGRHLHMGKGIAAVDAAWRHHGPFDVFVGHSFGGAVALNAALGTSMCIPARRPKGLVLLAPPNSLPALFRGFGRMVGLPAPAQVALEDKVFQLLGRPLSLFVASDQLKEWTGPTLVVHDMDDRDVLYSDALRMAKAGRHVHLHTTSGLGHRRILKDAGVSSAVTAFALSAGESPVAVAACEVA